MKKTVIVCDEKDWKFFREDEQGNRTEMKPKRKKVKWLCGFSARIFFGKRFS